MSICGDLFLLIRIYGRKLAAADRPGSFWMSQAFP